MDTLGIEVGAADSDNMRTFKRVTVDTGVFTYDEAVVWFRMLSMISNCQGLAACAEDYAHRIVVEDERNEGRFWLMADEEDWSFVKKLHYQVLMMAFGLKSCETFWSHQVIGTHPAANASGIFSV